jgi:hypothetical protein
LAGTDTTKIILEKTAIHFLWLVGTDTTKIILEKTAIHFLWLVGTDTTKIILEKTAIHFLWLAGTDTTKTILEMTAIHFLWLVGTDTTKIILEMTAIHFIYAEITSYPENEIRQCSVPRPDTATSGFYWLPLQAVSFTHENGAARNLSATLLVTQCVRYYREVDGLFRIFAAEKQLIYSHHLCCLHVSVQLA